MTIAGTFELQAPKRWASVRESPNVRIPNRWLSIRDSAGQLLEVRAGLSQCDERRSIQAALHTHDPQLLRRLRQYDQLRAGDLAAFDAPQIGAAREQG